MFWGDVYVKLLFQSPPFCCQVVTLILNTQWSIKLPGFFVGLTLILRVLFYSVCFPSLFLFGILLFTKLLFVFFLSFVLITNSYTYVLRSFLILIDLIQVTLNISKVRSVRNAFHCGLQNWLQYYTFSLVLSYCHKHYW